MFNGKPVIGLTGSFRPHEWTAQHFLNQSYFHAIRHFGGIPVLLPVMAEADELNYLVSTLDGLVLTGLPYFYAGATASGRGTVQVPVRQGIDYLGAIARSLLRLGFKRQVYISFHGPAHMTICPMIRDFYDETGVPILYMDMMMQFGKNKDLFQSFNAFHDITVGAYTVKKGNRMS